MTDPARRLCLTIAALLDQGRRLDSLARLLTAGALFGLIAHAVANDAEPEAVTAALVVAIVAGVAEHYYALRTGFDAALFRHLAADADLAGLDRALADLALRRTPAPPRPLAERAAGARAFLTRQALALGVQIAALAAAGLWIALT